MLGRVQSNMSATRDLPSRQAWAPSADAGHVWAQHHSAEEAGPNQCGLMEPRPVLTTQRLHQASGTHHSGSMHHPPCSEEVPIHQETAGRKGQFPPPPAAWSPSWALSAPRNRTGELPPRGVISKSGISLSSAAHTSPQAWEAAEGLS